MSVEGLREIRDRALPMLRYTADVYRLRTPEGYPVVIDSVETGVVGIEIDPSYALYFVTDGERLYAETISRDSRSDARSSAGREKFGGSPAPDRRPFERAPSDQQLRNLIAELMSRYNMQPGIIHVTDS